MPKDTTDNHLHQEGHNHTHDHSDHHHHHHGPHHHHHDEKNIKVAFFLNLTFTIIEIFGGLFTNSIAILSDAIHDLGDTIAIGTSFFLEKKSYKRRDKFYSYGYRRLSPFAAFLNLIILFSGSIIIIIEAVPRIMNPEEINSSGMIWFAILGIIFNGFAVLKLLSSSKSSTNSRAIFLHLIEDVLGWVAVLIGSIVIEFTGLVIIDPILSIVIAIYILFNAVRNLRFLIPIFLQGVPRNIDQNKIVSELQKIENVNEVHDLHVWTLDGEYNIASVHIVINDETKSETIINLKDKVGTVLTKNKLQHYTIEFEFESENCKYGDC